MMSLPMEYSPPPHPYPHHHGHQHRAGQGSYAIPHAHDIVFQQIVLRTTQQLAAASIPAAAPLAPQPRASRPKPERQSSVVSQQYKWDETDDEGYAADRDNAPRLSQPAQALAPPPLPILPLQPPAKPLSRVQSDVFLEIAPASSPSPCAICLTAIQPSIYRLRCTTSTSLYHIPCFESRFDLERDGGFGRIYPAPSSSSITASAGAPVMLDDGARTVINAWKAQRRSEGLEGAAGPDSGIRVALPNTKCTCQQKSRGPSAVVVGEKRLNVELTDNDDAGGKRPKFSGSSCVADGRPIISGRRFSCHGTPSERSPAGSLPSLGRSRSDGGSVSGSPQSYACKCGMSTSNREDSWAPELANLPTKLSDALKRLEGVSRTFQSASRSLTL